jgi:L-asparaginase II
LNKIGLPDSALQCGVHVPFNPETAKSLRAAGREPTVLVNNCSGKHAGMLAQAIDRGLSTADYLDPQHPVQVTIRQRLAELAELPVEQINVGVDGCSAPCFAMPLYASALAFAKLADAKSGSLQRVAQVMMTYPEMVAGEGRLDTDLMRAVPQRVVSKGGAEGYHGMGVIRPGGSALGIAIKIGDGDGKRGGHPVVIEVLRQLGVLDEAALTVLQGYRAWKITNHRGLEVGDVRASFNLMRAM